MITREEILKINKAKQKSAKTKLEKDLDKYIASASARIREGKFISVDNVFVSPIRSDVYFQEKVMKAFQKEGFSCSVKKSERRSFLAKGHTKKSDAVDIYHLHIDLNVG